MSVSDRGCDDLIFPGVRRGDYASLVTEVRQMLVWKYGTIEGREEALDGAEAL